MNEKTMQIEQIVKKVKECDLTPEEGLELIKSLGKTHLYEMVWDRHEFKGSKKIPAYERANFIFLRRRQHVYRNEETA
ncbi:hypothetical protein ACNSPU_07605 [Bacillus velezensis]